MRNHVRSSPCRTREVEGSNGAGTPLVVDRRDELSKARCPCNARHPVVDTEVRWDACSGDLHECVPDRKVQMSDPGRESPIHRLDIPSANPSLTVVAPAPMAGASIAVSPERRS